MRFRSDFADISDNVRLQLAQLATEELNNKNIIQKEEILRQTKLLRKYHAQMTVMDLTKSEQNRIFEILCLDDKMEELQGESS